MSASLFQHANFFSTCQTLCCVVGFEGSFRQVNQATLDILGYSIEHMLQLSFLELVHPDEQSLIESQLNSLSNSDTPLTFACQIKDHQDQYHYFLWQATPSLMEFAFYAVGIDASMCKQDMEQDSLTTLQEEQVILQEKHADLQLMYEELHTQLGVQHDVEDYQYYSSVIECMTEGVVLQTKSGQLHGLNPHRIEALLGGAMGLSDFMGLWQSSVQATDNGESNTLHLQHKSQNDIIYLQVQHRLLKDPQTQGTQARLLIFQDVSQETRLAQQLNTLQNDVKAMSLSHSEGIVTWDISQNTLDYSDTWKEMLGLSLEKHLGHHEETWFSRIYPSEYQAVVAHIRQFLKQKTATLDIKYRMQHAEGSYRWIHNNASIIPNEKGRPQRFVIIFEDVTEQQHIQQSLRNTRIKAEKESLYHHLFNAQAEAALVFSQQNRHILDANPMVLKLYGYAREEWNEASFDRLYADPTQCMADIRKAYREPQAHIPVSWHKHKDGTLFPVEIMMGQCEVKGQKLVYAVMHDITKRHLHEQTLREERNQYGSIFHAAPFPILYVDRHQHIVRANRHAAHLFNARPEELQGCPMHDLKLAYDTDDAKLDIQVLSTGRAVLGHIKEINDKQWQFNRLPYRDKAGNIIGLLLFIIDVSTFH